MNKISAIVKLMFVMVLFSTLTFAQYENDKDTHSKQDKTTQNDNDDNILGQDDDQFKPTAMTLAQDLQSRLTLSNDQVEKITDILVDYKDEVADIKRDKSDEMRASTDKTGTTKTETDRTDVVKTDTADVDGDNEMLGGRTDYEEKFREADISANEDIEDVLEEGQLAKYIQIKRDWWDSVKERVHTAAASQNQMENKDDDGLLDDNDLNDNN